MKQQRISSSIVAVSMIIISAFILFQSWSLGLKIIVVIVAIIVLTSVYQGIQKGSRSGIKNLAKAEGQKTIDDNIVWLKERWDRVKHEKDSEVLRTVKLWYFDEATEKQLSRLKRIGLKLSTKQITKGQASDIIGLFEPPEDENVAILKKHNIPLEGLNQSKARELIATLNDKPKRDNLKQFKLDGKHPTENSIIKQLSDDFIYFVKFFDSHIRYNETSPVHVPPDDRYWIRYEQAAQVGLALRGIEIPLEEIIKTLKVDQLSSLAKGQKFTNKDSAVEYLMDVPDIVDRFESMTPIDEWYQLKAVRLDMGYLESKWSEVHGDEY